MVCLPGSSPSQERSERLQRALAKARAALSRQADDQKAK